jgi:hypothetical protein
MACSLDDGAQRAQLVRYRRLGSGARLVSAEGDRLVIRLDEDVDTRLLDEALAIERECCPFLELGWDPGTLHLSVAVSEPHQAPALDAMRFALAV